WIYIFFCAAMLPNLVGVPKAIPSAHSRSSSDAVGSSLTSERWRPQAWFCEINISGASSSTGRSLTSAPGALGQGLGERVDVAGGAVVRHQHPRGAVSRTSHARRDSRSPPPSVLLVT